MAVKSPPIVSTHSRPKAAGRCRPQNLLNTPSFQLTAARRRLAQIDFRAVPKFKFQLTAARRRLGVKTLRGLNAWAVSTHSRPKAAGPRCLCPLWPRSQFQLTAARRRLVLELLANGIGTAVSTHSRPKAAGSHRCHVPPIHQVSTHSRPKAAGFAAFCAKKALNVSTHSRPKAAGGGFIAPPPATWRFNSQPPEGGWGLMIWPSEVI